MALSRRNRRLRIKRRIRKTISGTTVQPRLSVFRSNKEIYAQLINDETGTTIVAVGSTQKELKAKGNKIEIAAIVGKAIAEKAASAGVTNITFDRNGYLYHGRVKALAEAAREAGLKF